MKNLIYFSCLALVVLFSSCDHLIDTHDGSDGYYSVSFLRYIISTGNKEVIKTYEVPNNLGYFAYPVFYYVKDLDRIFFFSSDSSGYYDGKNNSFTRINILASKTMISNNRRWIFMESYNDEYFILNTKTLQINNLQLNKNLLIWNSESKPSFSTRDDKIVFFSIIDYDLNKVELSVIDILTQNISSIIEISNDNYTYPQILNPVFTSDDQKIFFVITNLLSTNKGFHQAPGLYSINIDGSNLYLVDTTSVSILTLVNANNEDYSLVRTPIKKILPARTSRLIYYLSDKDYNYLYKVEENGQNIIFTGYLYSGSNQHNESDFSISSTGDMLLLKGNICYLDNLSLSNHNSISFIGVKNIEFSQDEKSLEYTEFILKGVN